MRSFVLGFMLSTVISKYSRNNDALSDLGVLCEKLNMTNPDEEEWMQITEMMNYANNIMEVLKRLNHKIKSKLFDVRCKVCNMAEYIERSYGVKYRIVLINE